MSAESRDEARARARVALHLALIVAAGLIAYHGSFRVPFYFDDFPSIVDNPFVHRLENLLRLGDYRQFGVTEDIRNNLVTRFVAYLTFALNYRLHGTAVAGYHLFNLLVHMANALLVYELVRVTRARVRSATEAPSAGAGRGDGLALVAALLFVAHPVQTNAVTYIVQRFASLATLFCLLALVAYVRAALATTEARRRWFYGVSLLAAVLAMYSKETAFPLPVLVALYDVAFLPGGRSAKLRRLAPLAATLLLIPATVMTLASLSTITDGSVGKSLELVSLGHGSRWHYFITQWRVIVTYLRLLFVPVGLHLDYAYPFYTSVWRLPVLCSGLLLATLFGAGLTLLFRPRGTDDPAPEAWRAVGYGIVWFFVTLALESSVIPLDDLLFEYRLYLPSIGFFLAVTVAADCMRQRGFGGGARARRAAAVLALLLVGALAAATVVRNRVWQEPQRFWEDGVAKSPAKARARCNLADVYLQRGDYAGAIRQLETAKTLNPRYWPPAHQLALIHAASGRPEQAAAEYREAIARGMNWPSAFRELGRLYLRLGDRAAARDAFRRALELDPGDRESTGALRQLGG